MTGETDNPSGAGERDSAPGDSAPSGNGVLPVDGLQVLSVVHSAAFGGPHNQALHLHRQLTQSGEARLTVVLPDEPGDAAARLSAAGVPVLQLPLGRPRASATPHDLLGLVARYPSQIRSLRHLIAQRQIDVVEVHGLLNVDAAIAARLSGRGVVWQLIDTRPPRPLRWIFMPVVLALADVVMTTGRAVAAEYPGARLGLRRLIPFVPPVAEVTHSPKVREATRRLARRQLGVAEDAVLVAGVGNLNPQKGYEVLVDAVADCRRRGVVTDLELRVRGAVQTGHEVYAATLADRAVARGMPDSTIGEFEPGLGPPELLAAADIFALPSRRRSEGLPTVVLEAMAAGVPVVATRVGSTPEVVHPGEDGLLVEPDDVAQLARAIDSLAGDPSERRRLGLSAVEVARRDASPERFARTEMAAYRHAVGRARQRGGRQREGRLRWRTAGGRT